MDPNESTILAMCQMFLRRKQTESPNPLNRSDIESAVDQFALMLRSTGIDKEQLVSALEERFTIYAPGHGTLGSDHDHVPWLPTRRGEVAWRYWDRYKLLLNERLPPSAIESIDKVSEDVLQRLEDPQRRGLWDRRGLVCGHVQSGKTANYCGLICKAADVGYKVIIVLSGIHNSLRSQTQIRLDEGFLGFMSEPMVRGQATFRRVGVGTIDAGITANTATNRAERGDFNRTVANQFGIHPGGLPLLFVTKKNVSVLNNLNNWIASCTNAEDPTTHRRFVTDVPLLVIDDEADLASIDTKLQALDENGNPDPEHDPVQTNKQIRRLLRKFEKVGFVGYTATPFANIYIYDGGHTPELGDDLFPRSFIVNIPPPTNYMGPARVFGVTEDEDAGLEHVDPLPVVRVVSDHAASTDSDETSGWMPPRLALRTEHVPAYDGHPTVPPSLHEAIMAFILSTTVRTIRGSRPLHNSMLVHVVRYTKVQQHVANQVIAALKGIEQRVKNGDGARRPTVFDEFRELWERDFIPTNGQCRRILGDDTLQLPPWAQVQSALFPIISSIKVKVVNGSAGDVLDYESSKDTGINVIAVGGDKLSRGLTLEGLTVSYFLRASRMYDTLMQMGRWFGYRDGYVDICRLYTTAELLEWFTHITAASEELQREFENMVRVGGTPKDYGLKVRSHPALLVTSAVKMRHGTEMHLSFSGDISETIIFKRDPRWLAGNLATTADWLATLPAANRASGDGEYLWSAIPASSILDFLGRYLVHEDARRVNTELLAKYIRAQSSGSDKELEHWTVCLRSSSQAGSVSGTVGDMRVGLFTRAPFPTEDQQLPDRYTIRRLVSPADEAIDLTDDQRDMALAATRARWAANNDPRKSNEEPSRPGGRESREQRDKTKGLLLLYPLTPPEKMFPADAPPIIGLAISFPRSVTAREVTYTVNNVFTRQGGDDDSL